MSLSWAGLSVLDLNPRFVLTLIYRNLIQVDTLMPGRLTSDTRIPITLVWLICQRTVFAKQTAGERPTRALETPQPRVTAVTKSKKIILTDCPMLIEVSMATELSRPSSLLFLFIFAVMFLGQRRGTTRGERHVGSVTSGGRGVRHVFCHASRCVRASCAACL